MSTHNIALAAAVAMTDGPILEMGCGHGSTPLLHQMALGMNRLLVSMETDADWLAKFQYLEDPLHRLHLVTDWDAEPLERPWGVVLVDHAPGEHRRIAIRRLQNHADFLVVHDTETDHGTGADYKLEPVFESFQYRSDYRRLRPYTTIVSMTRPFPISECDQSWPG